MQENRESGEMPERSRHCMWERFLREAIGLEKVSCLIPSLRRCEEYKPTSQETCSLTLSTETVRSVRMIRAKNRPHFSAALFLRLIESKLGSGRTAGSIVENDALPVRKDYGKKADPKNNDRRFRKRFW